MTFVPDTADGVSIKVVNVAQRKKLHSSQPFENNYIAIN